MKTVSCSVTSVELGELLAGKIKRSGIAINSIDISYDRVRQNERPATFENRFDANFWGFEIDFAEHFVYSAAKLSITCPEESVKPLHQILISNGAFSIKTK